MIINKDKLVIFVSPHPDDVVISCYGTLSKYKKLGYKIVHVCVSECLDLDRNKNLPEEKEEVMNIIKPDLRFDLDLPNRRLYDTNNREIIRKTLEDIRDYNKVHCIYSPWLNDINQDHKVVSEEVIRVFRYNTILQYEITHSCHNFNPNYFIELSDLEVEDKINTVKIFKSQIEKKYVESEWLRGVMTFRGFESGMRYAEAFVLYKSVVFN